MDGSSISLDMAPLANGFKVRPLQPLFGSQSPQLPSLFSSSILELEFYLSEPFFHRFQQKVQSSYTLKQLMPVVSEYFSKLPYPADYRLEDFKFKYMNEVVPLDLSLQELLSHDGRLEQFARIDVIFSGKKVQKGFGQIQQVSTPALLEQGINPAVQEYLLPRSARGYATEPSHVEMARM